METTARLGMPLIEPGQAQKEMVHNEALTLLDAGVQSSVLAAGVDVPPSVPMPGQCWIVGHVPEGSWAGNASSIAMWTEGGWRFLRPTEGWSVWDASAQQVLRYVAGSWETGIISARRIVIGGTPVLGAQQPAVPTPSGGNVIDIEVRRAIAAMLVALRTHGLIAP
ncbi:DUF2793 domain-containing protein [Microvirga sp. SRT01]|uniref:DUF2793 domain-containing protein n=1 Tax=Sphingomonas longa TaxID=2778730 RepID=A0ABS2D777_9SPHN|nr:MULTISPECIES: DUF2793 domain-containing protein [Alphaproteobacteria]MBM6576767.1 DUF2793 domain-containing protein [Sphingomonas sp. BT552]MBR7709812.1 DUF2793 domain-containing protein [Microvirga sp. SRT01]